MARVGQYTEVVPQIRRLLKQGVTHAELSKQFNIRRGTIKLISNNSIYFDKDYQAYLDAKKRSHKAFEKIGRVLMGSMSANLAAALLNSLVQEQRFSKYQLKRFTPDERKENYRNAYRQRKNPNIRGEYLTWREKVALRGNSTDTAA